MRLDGFVFKDLGLLRYLTSIRYGCIKTGCLLCGMKCVCNSSLVVLQWLFRLYYAACINLCVYRFHILVLVEVGMDV